MGHISVRGNREKLLIGFFLFETGMFLFLIIWLYLYHGAKVEALSLLGLGTILIITLCGNELLRIWYD